MGLPGFLGAQEVEVGVFVHKYDYVSVKYDSGEKETVQPGRFSCHWRGSVTSFGSSML